MRFPIPTFIVFFLFASPAAGSSLATDLMRLDETIARQEGYLADPKLENRTEIQAALTANKASRAKTVAKLRDTLRPIEHRQKSAKSGRPYWFPTSIVDSQAVSRPAEAEPIGAIQESAELLLKIKELDLAEWAYRKALSEPLGTRSRIELLHGLAAVQFQQKGNEDLAGYRKAHETFRQAAAVKDQDRALGALSELGLCYTAWHVWVYGGKPAGGPTNAVASCTRALKISPRDEISAEIYEVLSSVYLDSGNKKLGIFNLKKALAHLKAAHGNAKGKQGRVLDSEITRIKKRLNRAKARSPLK